MDNFIRCSDETGIDYYISFNNHIVGILHPKLAMVIDGVKENLSNLSSEDLETV